MKLFYGLADSFLFAYLWLTRSPVVVLLLNAVSILSEDRFLARSSLHLRNDYLDRSDILQLGGAEHKQMPALVGEMIRERKHEVCI